MKTVVITGASRGLGMAFRDLVLSHTRHQVVVLTRSAHAPTERIKVIRADLSHVDNLAKIQFSGVFPIGLTEIIFLNNAGTVEPLGTAASAADLVPAFVVNSIAPTLIARRLADEARALSARLRILNISTGAATRPIPGLGGYCASKAAAVMLFDCLASEDSNVAVEHIDPGVIDTGMQALLRSAADFQSRALFQSFSADGKLQSPEAVAARILIEARII